LLILRYGIKDVDTVATKECRHVSEIKWDISKHKNILAKEYKVTLMGIKN
jgi:hypothetical protein